MTKESMPMQQDQKILIKDTFKIVIDEEGVELSWDENINPEYNYLSTIGKEKFEKIFISILENFLKDFTDEENVFTTETEEE